MCVYNNLYVCVYIYVAKAPDFVVLNKQQPTPGCPPPRPLYLLFGFLQVMEGNTDAYTSVINDLHPPVITRYVRLIPLIPQSTTVCMRVELYGCPWEGRGPPAAPI